jgi:leucine-zipper-like transcriptional regulator 1
VSRADASRGGSPVSVLDELRLFDLTTHSWKPTLRGYGGSSTAAQLQPRKSYGHLSAVSGDQLFIIGGQDSDGTFLNEVSVYDLLQGVCVSRHAYPRRCSLYTGFAISNPLHVCEPHDVQPDSKADPTRSNCDLITSSPEKPLVHLPFSVPSTSEDPARIYIFESADVSFSNRILIGFY